MLSSIDHQLFFALNSLSGRYGWLDALAIFLAVYGIFIMLGLAGILAVYKVHQKHFALAILSGLLSNLVIVHFLKKIVGRQRPFEVFDFNLLLSGTTGGSFSSGHAVMMFSIAFSFYGTKYFWYFLAGAFISSFSRVFVGVHYPADVVASILIAAAVVAVIRHFSKVRF